MKRHELIKVMSDLQCIMAPPVSQPCLLVRMCLGLHYAMDARALPVQGIAKLICRLCRSCMAAVLCNVQTNTHPHR